MCDGAGTWRSMASVKAPGFVGTSQTSAYRAGMGRQVKSAESSEPTN